MVHGGTADVTRLRCMVTGLTCTCCVDLLQLEELLVQSTAHALVPGSSSTRHARLGHSRLGFIWSYRVSQRSLA